MRVIVDLNSDGSKVSGELMFTGPCAQLEGNKVFESLKKLQQEKIKRRNFRGSHRL